DQVVRVWDCSPAVTSPKRERGDVFSENFSPKRMFRGHDRAVTGVCFNHKGERLFSASADHSVTRWDLNAPPEPRILAGGDRGTREAGPRVSPPVRALAFGAGGRLAAIGDDQIVRFWEDGPKLELENLGKHEADREPPAAVDVSFSSDGKRIASAASDNSVRLWDAKQARLLNQVRHPNLVTCVCFNPSGKQLATGDAVGGVRTWDVADVDKPKEIRSFKGLGAAARAGRGVLAVAFGAEGKRLAAAADRTVKVWDAETGKELLSLEGHEGELRALAFSVDGKLLATGGDDEAARLWDAESGKLLWTLEGHAGPVTGLAFSPDGRRLATVGGGSDETVRLWDVETGRELLQLAGAGRCVAFSPDGKRLAAADSTGQVLVWTATPGKER
ncbi:MAG: WD40 repeat domain-containing protein, partial [Planctomycetes bacterium]|nr:WD40 repeat domain-containing protein [Planctomycetota bacterium]